MLLEALALLKKLHVSETEHTLMQGEEIYIQDSRFNSA